MKIVLDTNILVSAFAIGGDPARILDLVVDGIVEGVTSEKLIDELTRVLGSKFGFDTQQLRQIEKIIRSAFNIVKPPSNPPAISRDPDDDHVLAVAKEVEVDIVVSGDKDLLVLKQYLNIQIMTATEFLQEAVKKSFD